MTSSFAAALRTARHVAGLTLEELAESSGVSVRALSDMERGRALGPQRRTVELIADALKLDGQARDDFLAMAKAGRTRSAYLTSAPGLCELPGSIGDFTGRSAELAWLARPSSAAVISGGAGLGKTTLAVRAAHKLRDQFPGGVHFVAALGMSGRPVGSDEILSRVLRALGVRDAQMPPDPGERAGKYRHLLRERPALVIADDVASEAQVRPLLPGDGGSRLLITSRRLLAGLEGVHRLHLDPMPAVDAYDLLSRIVAERAEEPRDEDLRELVDLLGGLPLALRIAGNRLVSRPEWTVADLVARLSNSPRRLDQLSAGDLKITAAFDVSYEQLPDLTRHVFRRAAVAKGADFSATLAAITAEVPVIDTEDHLDDLVDLGLVETAQGGRYRFHDLVRLYAYHRLEQEEPPATVSAARRRMITWLLATLAAAGQWFEPNGDQTIFQSAEEADAWIRTEAEHWFPALGAGAISGDHGSVVAAVASLHWFSDRWVDWSRWRDVFLLGYDSAAALGDARLEAEFLNYVAWTYTLPWRDSRPALMYAERALTRARTSGDVRQEAWAQYYTAVAQRKLGDPTAARSAARVAADLFEQSADVDAGCQTWVLRGVIALDLGDPAEALACYHHARQLAEDPASGMTPSIAEGTLPMVLSRIAQALGQLGRAAEAIPTMLRAVDLLAAPHTRLQHATVLWMLADLYSHDHAAEATDALLRAADVFEGIGELDRAAECWERAAATNANH
ncbi:NB-ARC domain-containing protein [Micromonospora purpureochromogenes]|uniref:NB-ARC domain-containing protein n=1 Tax=Micromonospora purpureochromogenes TaxID=47872 RepID=UPI0033C0F618